MLRCSCPRKMISTHYPKSGGNTYKRIGSKTPIISWAGRHTHPSLFMYKTNGSYAGRNRTCRDNICGTGRRY